MAQSTTLTGPCFYIIHNTLVLSGLHLSHHTQEVASPQFLYLLTAKPFDTKATGEIDDL